MAGILTNANYINSTIKPAIKSAIEAQGVTVPSTDSFLDYADRIGEIEGGGSGYQLKDLPTGEISTVNDAAELPLNALKVSVEAVQSGSGDPSPSNIRPISGWDSANIFDRNKNLLPILTETIERNGLTATPLDDGTIKLNGNCSAQWDITWNPNMLLKAGSYTAKVINQPSNINVYLFVADSYINFTDGRTITVASDTTVTYAFIRVVQANYDNEIVKPMVCLSSVTDLSFEPYQGKQYALDFPQTIYGAEWDVVNGSLYNIKNSVIIDGVTTGLKVVGFDNYGNNNRFYIYYSDVFPQAKYQSASTYCLCDKIEPSYVYTLGLNPSMPPVYACYPHSSAFFITLPATEYPDVAAANSFLQQNNVQVVYELATPTTIDLSPLSIRMLEGTNNLFADCGEVIEGEYFVGETKAYDLVEYIESDGTQAIDTGRQVVQGQTIEVTFEGSSNQTAYAWIFGGITSNDYYGYQFPSSSTVYSYNGGTSASSQSGFASDVLTQKALTFNGSANANIHVLGLWDGSAYSNQGKFKVYFLDIDGDYFVPAKRRRDGVYGLYDIANSQFLTDVASGNPLTGGESLGIRIG